MEKIGSSTMLRRALRTAVLVLAMFGVLTTTAGTASAASWEPISGQVYSSTEWLVGATVWTKSGDGFVAARFTTVPTHDLIKVGVRKYGGTTWSNSVTFTDNDRSANIYSYTSGTKFYARYARTEFCQSFLCSHSFEGQLYR